MSTTVNVRVDKSKLPQQLKDNSAANQQQAAQQAVDAAAAEQVRSNNEALRRRQQDATAKFRKSRHDPIGRRDGGEVTLPNGNPVIDGAAIDVARVGIRFNADSSSAFVYPWGIEAALGRRLSTNYTTAVQEAGGVGAEVSLYFENYVLTPPPEPPGNKSGFVSYWNRYEGRPYDATPTTPRNSLWRWFITEVEVDGKWYANKETRLVGCLPSEDSARQYFSDYDFYFEDRLSFPNWGSYCTYFAGYQADQGSFTNTMKSSDLRAMYSAVPGYSYPYPHNQTYTFILPAGGKKSLVVFVKRMLYYQYYGRFFWQYQGTKYTYYTYTAPTVTGRRYTANKTHLAVTGSIDLSLTTDSIDTAILNLTRCVLVSGSIAEEVDPTAELVEACNKLIPPIDKNNRTGKQTLSSNLLATYSWGDPGHRGENEYDYWKGEEKKTYTTYTYPAFEASNYPKAPYSSAPEEQQVLAKQLGVGYLVTSDHSGRFFTPAIYEWLDGNASLSTSYSNVVPNFYTPRSADSPFPNVYLSVGKGTEDSIEMLATATQPIDSTTAHTALDWVTVNTGSRYGDYLVWDWGNPEYCQQRLQALGMNV